MKAVVIGATKGMGRALARKLAERGDQLFLVGRDLTELSRSARDLEARGASGKVGTGICDLKFPVQFEAAIDKAALALKGLDAVIISAGIFSTQEELEANFDRTRELLTIDFTNTLLLCECARKKILAEGGGTLCVFSSVAGERGRKPVIIYGAAKAGLSHYLEGLDHKFRAQGLRVVTVKPGFVNTGMTEGLTPPPFAGEPDQVAEIVLRALDRGTPVIYAPKIWAWIMTVIRLLPRFVMRRVGF